MSDDPPQQFGKQTAQQAAPSPFASPVQSGYDFRPTPSITQSVATLSRNVHAKAWAKSHGLDIVNVSWEDCARTKNSCGGPCISDMTLVVNNVWMPVLRAPQFSDPILSVPSSLIQVTVGNESHHQGVALSKVSLQEYLTNIASYTELEHSLFVPTKDDHVVVSTQSCFLPLTGARDVDFHVGLFNYQSKPRNPDAPTVLVLVSTNAGTSAQVVYGDRRGDILYFNDHGTKRTLQATRLGIDRRRRGVDATGAMTEDEEAKNFVMIVQIPLVTPPRQTSLPGFGSSYGDSNTAPMAGQSCFAYTPTSPAYTPTSPAYTPTIFGCARSSDVEPAMVTLGQAHGPFPKLSKHSGVKRDPSFPIRVTVQFYQATSNGVVSEPIIDAMARRMRSVKTCATWTGSLVTSTSFPTTERAHSGVLCANCKQTIACGPLGSIRYKCVVCPDYDRCETCVDAIGHPPSHPFVRLMHTQYGPSNYMTLNRSEWTHPNTTCSSCSASPIVGILYRCTMCPCVDLCERCELTNGHATFDHPLVKYFRPVS